MSQAYFAPSRTVEASSVPDTIRKSRTIISILQMGAMRPRDTGHWLKAWGKGYLLRNGCLQPFLQNKGKGRSLPLNRQVPPTPWEAKTESTLDLNAERQGRI